jgi:eukaryotic-like serine/threonine-protein kinase
MNLSRELWLRVEPFLTTGLEMDAASRAAWLDTLEAAHPDVAPLLRKMLETHERAERAHELETVPKLAPAPPPSSAFSAGVRIGPFELLRVLGRGGMGEVWLARQADGRVTREVALKLPALHLQGGVWEGRFHRERDILAKLTHPNIARLFDAGVGESGQPYLAMEFVEGESLTAYADSHGLGIRERLQLFRQVLAATAHAHRHLVVHRDLKPANILIDKSGQVKLLDFGIAKLLDDEDAAANAQDLTRMGGRVMTLRYAAPEQASGATITTATDIYSLGVILHELVTGTSPYRAVREGKAFTEAALVGEDPAMPSSAAPANLARKVKGDLDAIILKAMRRDPAQRYPSIEQFDDDIARHLAHRPVGARAGTWRYLAGRFAARHKLPLAAATVVLVTTAAGVVMVDQQRRVAVAERARAERHFASVRKLANSFMFDVHDALQNLPGSLKARGMLVDTALRYLDSLSEEAGNDPVLALEVAVAYKKIGLIQGEPGGANTGDLAASLVNLEKSKRLFVALDALRPNDAAILREHRSLSYVLARAYFINQSPRWQEEIATTVRLAERIAELPGATPRDRARVASMLAEQAHLTSIKLHRTPEVVATMEKTLAILEALVREAPDELAIRETLAANYQRAAMIFSGPNRTEDSVRQAVEYGRKALATYESVLAVKPDEAKWIGSRRDAVVELGKALSYAGQNREADRTFSEALKLDAERMARDPKNVEMYTDNLKLLNLASLVAFRVGDHPRAIHLGREALALAERLPPETRKVQYVRDYVAGTKSHLGAALIASAQSALLDRDKRLALLREARSLLVDAIAFLDEIRRDNLGAYDEGDAKELTDNLARCDAAIARLSRS